MGVVWGRAFKQLFEHICRFVFVPGGDGGLWGIDFHGLQKSAAGDVVVFLLFVDYMSFVWDVESYRQYAGVGEDHRGHQSFALLRGGYPTFLCLREFIAGCVAAYGDVVRVYRDIQRLGDLEFPESGMMIGETKS